jgi:nucleoside-diphosphate-sugar epimerase
MNPEKTTALLVGGDLAHRTGMLLQKKAVHCIGMRRSEQHANSPVRWIQADLHDPRSLLRLPLGVDYLLYAVTPDERNEQAYEAAYVHGLKNLLGALDQSRLKRALFVSSTAVYGTSQTRVDESTKPSPDSFNGRVLLRAETLFQEQLAQKAVILRLSGIYGPQRTLVLQRLLSGQIPIPQNDQWTNRIHIDDAAGACAHLLLLPNCEPVYIGTDDTPMRMSVLYSRLAAMMDAPFSMTPNETSPVLGKQLSNQRLKTCGYTMKWPDSLQGYRAIIEAQKLRYQPPARS